MKRRGGAAARSRKHGLSIEPVPGSAYVGSSKNLKDLKDEHEEASWDWGWLSGLAFDSSSSSDSSLSGSDEKEMAADQKEGEEDEEGDGEEEGRGKDAKGGNNYSVKWKALSFPGALVRCITLTSHFTPTSPLKERK